MNLNRRPIQFCWLPFLLVLLLVAAAVPSNAGVRAATPTPEAGSGSSGEVTAELPAVDIPTTNEQGYTFDLKSSLKADLDSVPKESPVYELRRKSATLEKAEALADKLKIGAEVTDRGDGAFEASGNGQLYYSTELIQYFSAEVAGDGALPEDEEAIGFGRDWLRLVGLLPADLGDGRIVSRIEETKRLIVLYGPAEPGQVLASFPSISVTIGPGGVILEASSRWATVVRADVYLLMPAEQAWQIVKSGQAYIEANLTKAKLDPGSDVSGQVTFNDITVAYSTSGPPGGQQYLQPVYVFTGKLRVDDVDGSFPVKAYVPALANSGAPVGSTLQPGHA